MSKIIFQNSKSFQNNFLKILKKRELSDKAIDNTVEKIIDRVRKGSEKSLLELTRKYDKNPVTKFKDLVVSKNEINRAKSLISHNVIKALTKAASRIKNYHEKQLPKDFFYTDNQGVKLGSKWSSIDSVGLYVPGGSASYPSSVIMNAIPAIVAGVERIVMVCPAMGGKINPVVLAVAEILKIKEIYKIGGAQAIAALAFGTENIKKVNKIFGPGNAYVASAKKKVFGDVGIDMIAGPSEILVVADKTNDPSHIAIDLLSQAEHDENAQAILITDSENFARKVLSYVQTELKTLSRKSIAEKSWKNFGCIIVMKNINDSHTLVNEIAPEHLEISVQKPSKLLKKIKNAGAIFLGKFSPEAIGDYIAGPNHVLPTDRTAKFSSGLNVLDFMKRTSFVECSKESINKIGPDAITLANEEGLGAHARSIYKRLNKNWLYDLYLLEIKI